MKAIKATVFRLTFTQLIEPHEVTVHGEVVGTWTPAAAILTRGESDGARQTAVKRRPAPDLTKRA